MRILVLGIGNPILKDDGIGPRIIDELRDHVSNPDIVLAETSLAGMSLVEILSGFTHAIIVDAIQTGEKPGTLYKLTPENFRSSNAAAASQHETGLLQALRLGKELEQPMPEQVIIVAVEVEDICNFGEDLTPLVEKAIPTAVACVLSELDTISNQK